ncbi:MAG: FAD-dependent oxidoreductase [Armatimonadetes bacterium]|nr:FAD-dependent oxidoreductase [Armatimonadota bacterium]
MGERYPYVIIGSQLAGASAVEGTREVDTEGAILLVGQETALPYDRPPLSKDLWLGKKRLEEIFLHEQSYYEDQGVTLKTGVEVLEVDAKRKMISDSAMKSYEYEKLLVATGGTPRRLNTPGGNLPGICYYRTIDDFQRIRKQAKKGSSALVIGGGFIGSEMTAALCANDVAVTMIYAGPYLCDRVFPEEMGRAMESVYESKGVTIRSSLRLTQIEEREGRVIAQTSSGDQLVADFALAGIGIVPNVELAERCGLETDDGILVDEELKTSHPDVYAAGDVANFPYLALGQRMRVEHWDHAVNQGKQAGRNMAGAGERYEYMPYFFSDLFEFGYEAVGQVDSRLQVVADWEQEHEKGVLYYLDGGVVRGVMLCNVWDKVEEARVLIREGKQVSEAALSARIR